MSKRRKPAEPELPLFDLPLFEDGDIAAGSADEGPPATPEAAEGPSAPRRSPRSAEKKKAPRPVPEAPLLFSEEELAGTARDEEPFPGPEDEEEGEIEGDEPAWLQDRLLGGMADLTIQTATLGLTLVAVQLMGIPVSLRDWPAFAGLMLIFSFLYAVVPLAFWGHTPGMAWVGHTARSESDEPLSFPQTALRWVGALFTVLLVGLPLLLALGGRSLADRLSDSKTLQL